MLFSVRDLVEAGAVAVFVLSALAVVVTIVHDVRRQRSPRALAPTPPRPLEPSGDDRGRRDAPSNMPRPR